MWLDYCVAGCLCGVARLLTGVQSFWRSPPIDGRPCVYFANHRSHGDFVLIWASLSTHQRDCTRPVAGADYWLQGPVRRYLIDRIFRGVLIDRYASRNNNPISIMASALNEGYSLILFPEGTRNLEDGVLPFKSGMYHLAKLLPAIDFVPVWIDNLGRALPKGHFIPLPLLCSAIFGDPIRLIPGESRSDFLDRARSALLELSPPQK